MESNNVNINVSVGGKALAMLAACVYLAARLGTRKALRVDRRVSRVVQTVAEKTEKRLMDVVSDGIERFERILAKEDEYKANGNGNGEATNVFNFGNNPPHESSKKEEDEVKT